MLLWKKIINHNNKNYIVIKSQENTKKVMLIIIVDMKFNIETNILNNKCIIEFDKVKIKIKYLNQKNNYWVIKSNNISSVKWCLRIGPFIKDKKIQSVPLIQFENYNYLSIINYSIIRNDMPFKLNYYNIEKFILTIDIKDLDYQNIELFISKKKKIKRIKILNNRGAIFYKI